MRDAWKTAALVGMFVLVVGWGVAAAQQERATTSKPTCDSSAPQKVTVMLIKPAVPSSVRPMWKVAVDGKEMGSVAGNSLVVNTSTGAHEFQASGSYTYKNKEYSYFGARSYTVKCNPKGQNVSVKLVKR